MVSAREISQAGIPRGRQTWQNVHLVYTHGYGAVAAQVNTATSEGAPVLTLKDIPSPPTAEPDDRLSRAIYYGESATRRPFVVVNTERGELDFEGSTERLPYSGAGRHPDRATSSGGRCSHGASAT